MRLMLILIFLPVIGFSQRGDTTLNSFWMNGKFSVHARTFFMSTMNEGKLTDYHALGIGAGIGFESAEFRMFKFGISGFFIYNVWSDNLSKHDALSDASSRYEIGLFDLTNPDNRGDLDRLEELYIQYRVHKSFVRFGKIILNTPFINPQDGRMRPTLEQGLWIELHEIKNVNISTGWITHISPRSTVRWYDVAESIGIYAVGVNAQGEDSDYAGNLSSKGIGLLGVSFKNNAVRFTAWNTWIENISNTVIVQAEKDFPADNHIFYGGIQYVRQDAVGSGGNENPAQAYITPGTHSNIAGARVGLRNKKIDLNLNGTFFSDNARFLMPREWGREPFYTFLPRERNEGSGGVKAVSMNVSYAPSGTSVHVAVGVGHYQLPDVRRYSLNKYAMPSYAQFNADIRYNFKGFLSGTSFQFLYVYKMGTGRDYEDARNIINKVNMSNINLVLNYRFESFHTAGDSNR